MTGLDADQGASPVLVSYSQMDLRSAATAMKDNSLENEMLEVGSQDPARLVQLLTRHHKEFLENTIPELQYLAYRLQKNALLRFLENLEEELRIHFRVEERLIFPLILNSRELSLAAMLPSVQLACDQMKQDHRLHMGHLRVLEAFRGDLNPSVPGPPRILYQSLGSFCESLEIHSNCENDFLFQDFSGKYLKDPEA